jgi:hypothetical protein
MNQEARNPTIPESLISARLLMLQSKRLILATLERRLRLRPRDSMRARVDHMRHETAAAHKNYCTTVLNFGSSDMPEYWPAAYGRLVDTADQLTNKLRTVAGELPSRERYEVATEVEMLETLLEGWRTSIRAAMVPVA